ncbi:MAG: hypothetical protein SCARUB_00015 [Candidatus Scalindua rubra]|uniref:Uncharacterized protein n=1 Tax=Candidatus Scalindua rubra TaxID=1872076 RepID=A0A1E3XGJ3_9BACT|nr:MAG: hypothetical protein SCARUB_00015 [Candidatus Scalindua rubra]
MLEERDKDIQVDTMTVPFSAIKKRIREFNMPNINEATGTDLKVIEELTNIGWKRGDTLLYQQEYLLTPEQKKIYEGKKSIKPDITLTQLDDQKKLAIKTFLDTVDGKINDRF